MATRNPPASSSNSLRQDLIEKAHRIGTTVVGPAADAVDREARFPHESFAALRQERMLGAFIPQEFGGQGCSISDLAAICTTLGQYCASTAMVYAMHQIQIGCLVRHGQSAPFHRAMLSQLAEKEELLASATTEVGIGGDVRSSVCAVEVQGGRISLTKQAPVISYGAYADHILVTARRAPDAATSDQVIVLVQKADTRLEQTGTWDTMGMRGTCSLGYLLTATGSAEQVLPQPYAEISAQTMLPFSHIVWTSLWLGIATDAVNRARAYIRGEARKKPGTTPPGALRLAEVMAILQTMRATVEDGTREYERLMHDPEALSGIGFAIRMNNLKIAGSQLAVEIVGRALQVCGITGYRNDSKYSLTRHLRDAYGTGLMVANDRIYGHNASLLLVHKDE
ncbi:MAG: acyl-CoA dehydrogenase family protein [Gemmatimonadota bacterium]